MRVRLNNRSMIKRLHYSQNIKVERHIAHASARLYTKLELDEERGTATDSIVDATLTSPVLERSVGMDPRQLLKVTEAFWREMKEECSSNGPPKRPAASVVSRLKGSRLTQAPEFDVIICGGTLGIFLAVALQKRGYSVCIVEKRTLSGRTQEWNISREELEHLTELVPEDTLRNCIVTEFNPIRVGFPKMEDLWVKDILNLGVSPRLLIDALREEFISAGGVLLEKTAFKAAHVYDDGVESQIIAGRVEVDAGDINRSHIEKNDRKLPESDGWRVEEIRKKKKVTSRLLVDCMGHYSSIVKQLRQRQKPDGVVLVVGGALQGIPPEKNMSADLLYSFEDSVDDMQYFWEAFPADGGESRTIYMFSYTDCHTTRPTFTQLLEKYLTKIDGYQGLPEGTLKPKRLLFGGFPCYSKSSPLKPGWNRILQIGDASAAASPLSFGGFGSMIRHLPRLTEGLVEALDGEHLSQRELEWLQPYQPAISAAWLFQRSMSLRPGQSKFLPADHINRLMRCNFTVLKFLGERIMRPFLQDTLQFGPLAATMGCMLLNDPIVVCRVLLQVGPLMILQWFRHFLSLGWMTLAHTILWPWKRYSKSFGFRRWLDALSWGTGSDRVVSGSVVPSSVGVQSC